MYVLPQFSNVKLPVQNNKHFVNNIRQQITFQQLNQKNCEKRRAEKQLRQLQNNLFELTVEQWSQLQTLSTEQAEKEVAKKVQKHNKKLRKLGVNININVDSTFINKRRNNIEATESITNKQSIFNLSKRVLNPSETSVLEKGLKYGIKNKKVDKFEILARFEQLAQSLNKFTAISNKDENMVDLDKKNAFFNQLQAMAFEFVELSKQARDNLTDAEHQALEELAKDKSIIITKADKGNAVVIQEKSDYIAKIQQLLLADGKFAQMKEDETIKRELSLQNYLRSLKKEQAIPEEVYKDIYPYGSRAGILYGLPKIHKNGAPIRPIISAIGTYNYKLAKYLDKILKPLVSESNIIIKDTFDFVNRVSQIQNNNDQYMVSFDVESLFTNIPTLETIDIIIKRAFKRNRKFNGLNKESLKKLLIICTQKSHFQFNGIYYEQIDGVAMGSPLGPLFANIFMDEFEKTHMEKLKELGVKTWMRYVDDVFATLTNSTNSNDILNYINQQHKNIKFTIEREKNNKIPFLDTCVTRNINNFTTSIYHKPTFTGVYLNWTSLTSRKYKISLIYCLCDRIWKICQIPEERDIEFKKLKATLAKNEYPEKIIDQEITKFIKNRTPNQLEQQTPDLQQQEQQEAQEKEKRYIVLPYSNNKADEFANRLTKLVNNTLDKVELKVAFKAPNEIGKMFPFKDNIKDKRMLSGVVYHIKCETCNQSYIGITERILMLRIKEHNAPNKPNNKYETAVQMHVRENPTHKMDANNIEVIDRANTTKKLELKEMLHINKHKPELNTQHAASYKQRNNKDKFKSQLNTIIIARHQA